MTAPPYVDPRVVGAPIDFTDDPHEHIGPVETVNQRFRDIGSKTTCGMLTQMAGICTWGAWRLKGKTDVTVLMQLIEASFAFQIHPSYVNRDAAKVHKADQKATAKAATENLQLFIWRTFREGKYWLSYYQPFDSAFHPSYMVRYILPKNLQRVYGKWLDTMLARMNTLQPKPLEILKGSGGSLKPSEKKKYAIVDSGALSPAKRAAFYARHWGRPLPPESLDLAMSWEPPRRLELVGNFLRGIQSRENPLLRSPDEMKSLGYLGRPYEYPTDEKAETEMYLEQIASDLART